MRSDGVENGGRAGAHQGRSRRQPCFMLHPQLSLSDHAARPVDSVHPLTWRWRWRPAALPTSCSSRRARVSLWDEGSQIRRRASAQWPLSVQTSKAAVPCAQVQARLLRDTHADGRDEVPTPRPVMCVTGSAFPRASQLCQSAPVAVLELGSALTDGIRANARTPLMCPPSG